MYEQTNFETYHEEGHEPKAFQTDIYDKMGVFDFPDVPPEREANALPDLVCRIFSSLVYA